MNTTINFPIDAWRHGAKEIELNELMSGFYSELHRMASRRLRGERSNHTLQATALVHEAYVRLCNQGYSEFANSSHFLALTSKVMRQVLVDHARARGARKRGGGDLGHPDLISLTTNLDVAGSDALEQIELLELDRALTALAREDELLARLIEMRYFGGITAEETASALGISVHVVRHDLRLAQAWLRREMNRAAA